jgi:polyhydroxybutyrate depolymerase
MTGPSNGGNMSFYYACRRPGRLTAIAPVIASMQKSVAQGCLARDPLPVHLTASTDDPLLPFEGGTTSPYAKQRGTTFEERLSVPDSIAFWARINRCNGAPVETGLRDRDSRDGTTVTRIAYRGCAAPTELYRVNSGGHQVPRYTATAKREQLVERLLGKQSHDIDQEEEAQAFFRAAVRR